MVFKKIEWFYLTEYNGHQITVQKEGNKWVAECSNVLFTARTRKSAVEKAIKNRLQSI